MILPDFAIANQNTLFVNNRQDFFAVNVESRAFVRLKITDSDTKKDDTSQNDEDEEILQTPIKERRAHVPRNSVTEVKKLQPHENKNTENNKNVEKQSSTRGNTFYKCTCNGKMTMNLPCLGIKPQYFSQSPLATHDVIHQP